MSDREAYFARAQSWAVDTRVQSARSRRVAWIVAGCAVAVALFEAVALAMLAPLKTVHPVTLLVEKQTGFVQALDPLSPRRVAADDALTNAFLAQYVTAREGFDRGTVSADYRRVALWSTGRARQGYVAQMPAANPASPLQRYPGGVTVAARVKSVSRLNPGIALVRFDTQIVSRDGQAAAVQPWIAIVRFRFTDAPMRFEDRLVNPLGFQVSGYRRDAEAPPPPPVFLTQYAPTKQVAPAISQPGPSQGRGPASRPLSPPAPPSRSPERAPARAAPPTVMGSFSTREVPIANLPLGSPLSPAGSPPQARADSR